MTIDSGSNRSVFLRRSALAIGCAVSLLALAACDKKAEGQVVAVVNGEEVTMQQLNGELGAVASQGEPDQQTRTIALSRLIHRTRHAHAARKDGLDKSPDYILREKMLKDNLLLQMMGEKLARDNKQPSAQQLDQMISENPQAFAERTVFALDQLVFARPSRNEVVDALTAAKTMDQVVATLNKFGVKFQRGNSAIDSANLPVGVFRQFKTVGTSEPMIIPAGQMVTVAKILEMKAAPVGGEQARAVAGNAFVKREVDKALKAKLDASKKAAKIEYQSGFSAPTAPGATPSGSAAPAPAPAAAN